VLIPKTRREIWLNRVRVWLPPAFVVLAVLLRRPAWHLWGIPLVLIGEGLRTWAAGHLVKDEQLTIGGPYAHVRNPLYLGSLLSGLGFMAIVGDWVLATAFAGAALAIYLPTVRQEEDYLRRMHGEAFEAYRRAVPAIVPRLRAVTLVEIGSTRQAPALLRTGLRQSRFEWRWVWLNKEHRTWLALAAAFALLAARTWCRAAGH
jgi:protein-S-isoprenylcysteine O-methyltransferase Ste14